jgi:hypothetical protein
MSLSETSNGWSNCGLNGWPSFRLDLIALTAAGETLEELSALAEVVSCVVSRKILEPGAYGNSGGECVTFFATCP